MPAPAAPDDRPLEEVRGELRRLGYLSNRFDRYLLQDALRPRHGLAPLLATAARVGLLVALVTAPLAALALALANSLLRTRPLDLLPLILHLLVPIAVAAGVGYLLLGLVVLLVLRLYPVRHLERLALAAALLVALAGGALAVWLARDLLREAHRWELAVGAVVLPVALYGLVRVLQDGFLALAIRLTDRAPLRLLRGGRRGLAAAAVGVVALLAASGLVTGEPGPGLPPFFPSAPGEAVLLVGVDGVLGAELDYLLARGDLPTLQRLAGEGHAARYRRPTGPPATLWTTVATGLPTPAHGVDAIDSFRPLGTRTPLARSGPLRHYWRLVAVPLRLAEHRPILAARRTASTFWELVARGGAPIAAIDWWATYPAEPLAGLVVAHGAYGLLGRGDAAAVAPAAQGEALAALAREVAVAPPLPELRVALPAAALESLLERALRPDRFYREALRFAMATGPRAAALYLPALDLAADGWSGSDVAFADLVRDQLAAADRLLAEVAPRFATVIVVADPGRRGGDDGRVVLWRRAGCAATPDEIPPAQVAATLLRALGLPQSAELPPPIDCGFAAPPAVLPTYGVRQSRSAPAAGGAEYLKNLESLGYL